MPCPAIVSCIVLNGFTDWYLNFQHVSFDLALRTHTETLTCTHTYTHYPITSLYFIPADQLATGQRWIFKVNAETFHC